MRLFNHSYRVIRHDQLTLVMLRSNSIEDAGARMLFEALKTNSTLTSLDLSANKMKDQGAQVLSAFLMTNLTLTTLKLESNIIGDQGARRSPKHSRPTPL
ncbi:hypothetical protein BGZ81_000622 [Podila clonocystis]|nr:hypothetical protein BGZ81_000622 [Podila clonocystis]